MAKWKCRFCGETKGTISGICPKCGPTQTLPLDDEARKVAGIPLVSKKKNK